MTASEQILILAVAVILYGRYIDMILDNLTTAVHAASAAIKSISDKNVALTAEKAALTAHVADLTSQVAAFQAEATTAQALTDELNAAVAAVPAS